MQLYRAVVSEYIKEVFGIRYRIENYIDKPKYKAKDKSCGKIRKHLIINLKEYNIW